VRLREWDALEQVDIIESEKRDLLWDFGKVAIQVMATCADKDHAMSLVNHLKKFIFIEEGKKEKAKIGKQAEELIRLTQLTYRISPGAGSASVEITREE
jgi:hypothetical protein